MHGTSSWLVYLVLLLLQSCTDGLFFLQQRANEPSCNYGTLRQPESYDPTNEGDWVVRGRELGTSGSDLGSAFLFHCDMPRTTHRVRVHSTAVRCSESTASYVSGEFALGVMTVPWSDDHPPKWESPNEEPSGIGAVLANFFKDAQSSSMTFQSAHLDRAIEAWLNEDNENYGFAVYPVADTPEQALDFPLSGEGEFDCDLQVEYALDGADDAFVQAFISVEFVERIHPGVSFTVASASGTWSPEVALPSTGRLVNIPFFTQPDASMVSSILFRSDTAALGVSVRKVSLVSNGVSYRPSNSDMAHASGVVLSSDRSFGQDQLNVALLEEPDANIHVGMVSLLASTTGPVNLHASIVGINGDSQTFPLALDVEHGGWILAYPELPADMEALVAIRIHVSVEDEDGTDGPDSDKNEVSVLDARVLFDGMEFRPTSSDLHATKLLSGSSAYFPLHSTDKCLQPGSLQLRSSTLGNGELEQTILTSFIMDDDSVSQAVPVTTHLEPGVVATSMFAIPCLTKQQRHITGVVLSAFNPGSSIQITSIEVWLLNGQSSLQYRGVQNDPPQWLSRHLSKGTPSLSMPLTLEKPIDEESNQHHASYAIEGSIVVMMLLLCVCITAAAAFVRKLHVAESRYQKNSLSHTIDLDIEEMDERESFVIENSLAISARVLKLLRRTASSAGEALSNASWTPVPVLNSDL